MTAPGSKKHSKGNGVQSIVDAHEEDECYFCRHFFVSDGELEDHLSLPQSSVNHLIASVLTKAHPHLEDLLQTVFQMSACFTRENPKADGD